MARIEGLRLNYKRHVKLTLKRKMRVVTLYVPDNLFQEIVTYAQLNNINRSQLIRDAIRQYLRGVRNGGQGGEG